MNYDYTVKRKQRLIVDAPTDMELLDIEMSLLSKPMPEEPRQPPSLYKIESRPIQPPSHLSPRTEKLQELRSLQIAMMGTRPDDLFGRDLSENSYMDRNPY
jgi:hypothetical protein